MKAAPRTLSGAAEEWPADYREERLRAALRARAETLSAAVLAAETALREVREMLDQIDR